MKNIVIIGGGTGTYTLLAGLRQFPTNNAVIVSTADDGGSTGKLRRDLGVMPVGDLRQCLVGLSYTDDTTRTMFSYRFTKGDLAGHSIGNIILAALEKSTGSIEKAIAVVARLLNVRGEVVPVTLFPAVLSATLQNGKRIVGEHFIDEPSHDGSIKIKELKLKPSGPANPRALRLIQNADAIVFGPGDLFTSTIPNLLVKGVGQAIAKSRAKKIMVANMMTKHGQTDKFTVSDSARALQKYLGQKLDAVIVNTGKPPQKILKLYQKERAEIMKTDSEAIKKLGIRVIEEDLLSGKLAVKVPGDSLKRSLARHDSEKLAKIIYKLVS